MIEAAPYPNVADMSSPEHILATAMIERGEQVKELGHVALRYTLGLDGNRFSDVPPVTDSQMSELNQQYWHDPAALLQHSREELIAVSHDAHHTPEVREKRLDRYMDAHLNLTLKMDHSAFPATQPGEVGHAVPKYIPDGFVDMGDDVNTGWDRSGREMIVVDKRQIFDAYRPVLKDIFSGDYSQDTPAAKQKKIFDKLAQAVDAQMPYDQLQTDLGRQKVSLAALSEGVCRHQALTFQVLSQFAGLNSQLLKGTARIGDSVGKHATVLAEVGDAWYAYDISNPDTSTLIGQKVWMPGIIPIDRPPYPGEKRVYSGVQKLSGTEVVYSNDGDMAWMIEDLSGQPAKYVSAPKPYQQPELITGLPDWMRIT